MQVRTSFSLPAEQLNNLKTYGPKGQNLARLCLKRYLRLFRKGKISSKATCLYNPDQTAGSIKIFFTADEHLAIKLLRIQTGKSASYLLSLALKRFLPLVLRVFAVTQKRTEWGSKWQEYIKNLLRNVTGNSAFLEQENWDISFRIVIPAFKIMRC